MKKTAFLLIFVVLMACLNSCTSIDANDEAASSYKVNYFIDNFVDESAPLVPREKFDLITENMPLSEMVKILGKAHSVYGAMATFGVIWHADNGDSMSSRFLRDRTREDYLFEPAEVLCHEIMMDPPRVFQKNTETEEETTAETSYVYQPPIVPSKPLETVAKEETK